MYLMDTVAEKIVAGSGTAGRRRKAVQNLVEEFGCSEA